MIAHLLNVTVTVSRKSESASVSSGAPVATWANALTGVPCAVQNTSARQSFMHQRETGVTSYNVFFAPGTDVRNGDRLIVSGGIHGGKTLSVTSPPSDGAGRGAYVQVEAEHAAGGGGAL